ncbi:hypothetical protein SAMN04488055_0996 [Chitinophaga niabensis]|uniref:Uncharacterized protein n=1 Tax=Chitinophaga niabensis TaxID=536979 RepID=A0A1N6DQH6_9BACT|nr:hypothetical protein SAMN04488055_0996 [Chitinophaga niabensis]
MPFLLLCIINIALFIVIRYVSLLSAFLLGMGAGDHYKYESYAYLPGTILHLIVLGYYFIKTYKKEEPVLKKYRFVIIFCIISFLSVAGFLHIIPYSIIPF